MTVDVHAFGAIVDGATLNTRAFQSAIDACTGGGTVFVPAGRYRIGSIELRSGVTLSLNSGAVLLGSEDLNDYRVVPFAHNEFPIVRSLVFALGQKRVSIVGQGEILMNGDSFMDWSRVKSSPKMKTGVSLDPEQASDLVCEEADRPSQPIFFHDCEQVLIEGVTLADAPCWTLTLSACRNVRISGTRIVSGLRVPNGDGIHVSACKDVTISDCAIVTGDDCIAMTGITKWDQVCERIVVSNCVLSSRSAAIRLGHMSSKVRDVCVSNVVVHDSNRGIAIFAGEGGWVEGFVATGLQIRTRLVPGGWWGHGEPLAAVAHDGGRISRISVSHVNADSENGVLLYGKGGDLTSVRLEDWDIALRHGKNRNVFEPVRDLQPAPLQPAPDPSKRIPWLHAESATDVQIRDVRHGRAKEERAEFETCAMTD